MKTKILAQSFVVIVPLYKPPYSLELEEGKIEKNTQKTLDDMITKLFETEPIGVYSFKENICHAIDSIEKRDVYMLGKALIMLETFSPGFYETEVDYLGVGFVMLSTEIDMQIKNIRSALSLILNTHELGFVDIKRYERKMEIEIDQEWGEFVGSGPDISAFLRENSYIKTELKEVNLFAV